MQQDIKNQIFRVPNIMIRQTFSSIFKRLYWQQINQKEPHFFLLIQNSILKFLLSNQEAFQQIFIKFYNNHNHLYHWYLLANDKHEQMKKYVFSSLLKKPIQEYRSKMKQNVMLNTKNNKQINKINFDAQKYCTRGGLIQSPKKQITFKDIQNITNLDQNERQKLIQDFYEDYHQLFMRTFQACEGSKYIFYDFTKHMKGFHQRIKYNKYIRVPQKNSNRSGEFGSIYQRSKKNQTISYLQNSQVRSQNVSYHYQKQNDYTKQNTSVSKYELVPIGTCFQKKVNTPYRNIKRSQFVFKKFPTKFGKPKFLNSQKVQIKI